MDYETVLRSRVDTLGLAFLDTLVPGKSWLAASPNNKALELFTQFATREVPGLIVSVGPRQDQRDPDSDLWYIVLTIRS